MSIPKSNSENVLLSSMFAVFVLSLACKAQEIFIVARRLSDLRATRTYRTQGEQIRKQRRQNEN